MGGVNTMKTVFKIGGGVVLVAAVAFAVLWMTAAAVLESDEYNNETMRNFAK